MLVAELLRLLLLLGGLLSLGALAWLWLGVGHRPPSSRRRSLTDLLSHYAAARAVSALGLWQRRRLESDTRNVQRAQDDTLLRRLRSSRGTEYGALYRFREIADRQAFRRLHPLTRHGHYQRYVERVALGEQNVLTSERPTFLAPTAGTSDLSGLILSTNTTAREFFLQGVAICVNSMLKAYPGTGSLQKTSKFFHAPKHRRSESGIPIGPDSSPLGACKRLLSLYSTPPAALEIETEPEALYVHLLFALKDRKLGTLEANSAATICYSFGFLQNKWRELIEDIRLGRLSPELDVARGVRLKLDARLKPDPRRATELSAEFERGFGGIARRVWPHLNLLLAVDSGSSELYGNLLKQSYCQGLPVYSPVYAATEGLIGVNLWPEKEERRYLLCPRSMFCEFIPVDLCDEERPQTLFMDQVKANELYELVITNASGLYRYRSGDVIKVVELYHQCPVVEFKYRLGQTLNVRGEKISEEAFYRTLQNAVRMWSGVVLLDYCCAESGLLGSNCGSSDPHYEVFIEVKGVRNLTEEQRCKLDQCLQEDSAVYKSFRRKGSLGPARVHLVARGGFRDLRLFLMGRSGRACDPFATDRLLRRGSLVDFLRRKVVP
uniref:GH3 domain containing n=1 Tax=Callorhinchus milii TaxID=7868 RepID=A0A4W3GV41_CALMI|eukprot:gi/632981615/ref/XP_007907690.1/ PREDICTED: GH3 domain-containing protein [Callorhinchus milii]